MTASSTGFEIFIASCGELLNSKFTSAEWPSREICEPLSAPYGESILRTTANGLIVRTTSSTAARKAGSLAVSVAL